MNVDKASAAARKWTGTDIASDLVARIENQELTPGTRLKEVDLAVHYGVSRGPVREALRSLAARNWVHMEGRKGATVAKVEDDESRDAIALSSILFGLCARLAALRARPPEIDRILALTSQIVEAARAAHGGQLAFARECARVVASASNNKRIAAQWESSIQGGIASFAPREFRSIEARTLFASHWADLAISIRLQQPDKAEAVARKIPYLMLDEIYRRELGAGGTSPEKPSRE